MDRIRLCVEEFERIIKECSVVKAGDSIVGPRSDDLYKLYDQLKEFPDSSFPLILRYDCGADNYDYKRRHLDAETVQFRVKQEDGDWYIIDIVRDKIRDSILTRELP